MEAGEQKDGADEPTDPEAEAEDDTGAQAAEADEQKDDTDAREAEEQAERDAGWADLCSSLYCGNGLSGGLVVVHPRRDISIAREALNAHLIPDLSRLVLQHAGANLAVSPCPRPFTFVAKWAGYFQPLAEIELQSPALFHVLPIRRCGPANDPERGCDPRPCNHTIGGFILTLVQAGAHPIEYRCDHMYTITALRSVIFWATNARSGIIVLTEDGHLDCDHIYAVNPLVYRTFLGWLSMAVNNEDTAEREAELLAANPSMFRTLERMHLEFPEEKGTGYRGTWQRIPRDRLAAQTHGTCLHEESEPNPDAFWSADPPSPVPPPPADE
jgi:hypothetical protein